MAQIKDLKRMCICTIDCDKCPFGAFTCDISELPDNADEIVDDWVKKHPVKTYAQDFFEKFPNAIKLIDGRPGFCRAAIYGDKIECPKCGCYECWNQEMKENA